jgi:hypothetical protein
MQAKQEIINLLDVLPVDIIEKTYLYAMDLKKQKEAQGMNAFEELMHYMEMTPSIPDDTVYDDYMEISLRERGLLP